MINMLLALTKGETSGNYNTFIHSNYYCAMGILQDLWINNHALQEEETTFFDNGQELLLYTNLGTYSCNYTEYCNIKFVTSVYSKDGLILEYPFDYESDASKCLYDLFQLRKAEPERWLYRLDSIYNKYGIDTVNKVREGINL